MKIIYNIILGFILCLPILSYADKQSAMDAVDSVMFDMDELGMEYINYRVDASSNVSMTVDDSVPEGLYEKLLDRLRAHKNINSVLASQGPVCPIPYTSNRQQ